MRKRLRIVLAAGAICVWTRSSARADSFYRENFPNAGGAAAYSAVGWTCFAGNGSTSAAQPAVGNGGAPNAMISGGASAPSPNGANTANAGNTGSSITTGFAVELSANGAQDFLAYTGEAPIDRTSVIPTAFSWYAGSYYSGDVQRLAINIQTGPTTTAWYASTLTTSPAGFEISSNTPGNQGFGAAASTAGTFTTQFTTDASAWRLVNFAPGQPMSLGAVLSSPLPDGAIVNFGVYSEIGDFNGTTTTDERTFFDTYEVTATPEPTTALFALALPLLARRRRR